MPEDQKGLSLRAAAALPQRIMDSAAVVISIEPRWGYLRIATEDGHVEFTITKVCAEDLIIDLQNFLVANAPSRA